MMRFLFCLKGNVFISKYIYIYKLEETCKKFSLDNNKERPQPKAKRGTLG